MNQAVTQAEFARMLGCARSYITALKKSGRLVLNAIGNVLVEESRARITETADPNRDDVAQRWAAQRPQNATTTETEAGPRVEPKNEPKPEECDHNFQGARAKKEYYLAEQARLDYEKAIGKLVEKADVAAAIEDVSSVVRQELENLPHRTAPELVGKDLDSIRATLKQTIHTALANMEREYTKRLEQMGSEE